MKRFSSLLAAALVAGLPAAAYAQNCSAVQLAANPLVGMGFRALVRINSTAFDLSCYYQNLGGGLIGFNGVSPSVEVGTGTSELKATINQANFDFSDPTMPLFNYGVASNQARAATTPTDFVFAFASPLASATYVQADAQVGITRASGNPTVSVVPGGAASTMPLGGAPAYLVAQTNFMQVAGGGTNANPGAVNLGVDVGGTACSSGTACPYAPASSSPNANISAWLTVVSYRQARPSAATRSANAQVNGQVSLVATAVPEPATVTLTAAGIFALGGVGFTRRRQKA